LTLFPPTIHPAPSLASVDTVYSADSIEFCPDRNDIFVCGTYQIEEIGASSSSSSDVITANQTGETTSNEDLETVDDQYTSGPATRRLGRALVYQISTNEQSL
jgi:diphthine methyl ester acylhydrolase